MTPQPQYPWEWRHDPGTVSFEPAYPPTRHFFGLGFRTRRSSHRAPPYGMQTETLVIFPYGQLCVLGALLPAWRAASWARRRRRRRPGHCRQCGYDLRASNDRCPECGNPM